VLLQRPFPATATVSVHDRRETSAGTEVTFDITYIPHEHEERLIVVYGPGGVSTRFEGGSIAFGGLLSQGSQADYAPVIGSQVATLVYEWRSTFTGDGQRNTSTGITVRHVIVE
jgi:hypothetical protein